MIYILRNWRLYNLALIEKYLNSNLQRLNLNKLQKSFIVKKFLIIHNLVFNKRNKTIIG